MPDYHCILFFISKILNFCKNVFFSIQISLKNVQTNTQIPDYLAIDLLPKNLNEMLNILLRLRSGTVLRLRSGTVLRLRSGTALRLRSGTLSCLEEMIRTTGIHII